MLKINLLPTQRRGSATAPADANKLFAVATMIVLSVVFVGLYFFHSDQEQQVARVRNQNNDVEARARTTRNRVSDHQRIRDELAEIRVREESIGHLEAARTGPTSMLIELSHLLSSGGRPAMDPAQAQRIERDNSTQTYNRTWDTRRVWLTRFVELDRNVTIEGEGKTPDDVGEFMRRMMLSQYFDQVRLERSEGAVDNATKISLQKFRLAARVRY
jgi:type IV pilus assembly protein PilN